MTTQAGVEVVVSPDDAALAALYRDARAVVYPSTLEGFGLPVAEAMAAGRPVVASDLDAIREWAGDVPWYVPPGDAARLADMLSTVLSASEAAAERAVAGIDVAAGLRWSVAGERTAERHRGGSRPSVTRPSPEASVRRR